MEIPDLENLFYHHPAGNEEKVVRYHSVREFGLQMAKQIDDLCPDSREKSVAITKLEECVMWANAAIARNE